MFAGKILRMIQKTSQADVIKKRLNPAWHVDACAAAKRKITLSCPCYKKVKASEQVRQASEQISVPSQQ